MKTFKEQKWMIIIYGVVLLAVGLVDFIFSIIDVTSAIKIVSYSIACGLFLIGLLHILTNLIKDTKSFFKSSLALGSLVIAFGVVFVALPEILGEFLIYFVASFIIAISVIFAIKGVVGIKFKYKLGWIIIYFLLASIGITLSILAYVYIDKSPTVFQIIYCVMGAIAMIAGAAIIYGGIKTLSHSEDKNQ